MDMKKITLSLLTLILVTITLNHFVTAQDSDQQGLTISPVVFELNADPGDILTNDLKVFNHTDYKQTVKILIEDFTPIGEEGQVVLKEPDEGDNLTYSLASWTKVYPEEFTLEPKKQKIISFN